jgi:hypothetical protein
MFGATAGRSVIVVSSTTLTVSAPPHGEGVVDIQVRTAYGTSAVNAQEGYTFAGYWTATAAPLPDDADLSRQATLNSIACPDITWCVAVGDYNAYYVNGEHFSQPLVQTLSDGAWTSIQPPVPANASADEDVDLSSVVCATSGSCTAFGLFRGPAGGDEILIETLSAGVWTATRAPLPADADPSRRAFLTSMGCPTETNCIAVGSYNVAVLNGVTPVGQTLLETFSAGIWTATAAPLPSDVITSPDTGLTRIACPTVDWCTAIGFDDATSCCRALIETFAFGTWTAKLATLPVDATSAPNAYLFSISCHAVESCTAVGRYDSTVSTQPLIETLGSGVWTPIAAPRPTGAINLPVGAVNFQTLVDVSCDSATSCITVGTYDGSNGEREGLIDSGLDGHWQATEAPRAVTVYPYENVVLQDAVCPVSGTCVATGYHAPQPPLVNGTLIETLASGIWTPLEAPMPADAATQPKSRITDLACAAANECIAVGSYTDASGATQILIDTQHP